MATTVDVFIVNPNGQDAGTSSVYQTLLGALFVSGTGTNTSGTGINPSGANITFTRTAVSAATTEFATLKSILDTQASTSHYTLVCQNTSITVASVATVRDTIAAAIIDHATNPWDIFYLSRHMDKCESLSNATSINGYTSKIRTTPSPYGLQCFILSPTGLATVASLMNTAGASGTPETPLNVLVNGWITSYVPPLAARTISPNLFTFDITQAGPGTRDYVKTVECRESAPDRRLRVKDTEHSMYWFIVIFIIVLVIAWFLIRHAPMIQVWTSHQTHSRAST